MRLQLGDCCPAHLAVYHLCCHAQKAVTDPSYNPEQLQHNGISQAIVDRAEKVLRAHLPDAVSERIETGHVAFISELRVCTILFIGFPSLKVRFCMLTWLSPLVGMLCEQHTRCAGCTPLMQSKRKAFLFADAVCQMQIHRNSAC